MKIRIYENSLFKRLFVTFGLTIVIGFAIMGILLLKLFDNYLIESKKQILLEQGLRIRQEFALSYYTRRLNRTRVNEQLEILDKYLNARIWLVDSEGVISRVSKADEIGLLGQAISRTRIDALFQGETLVERGSFGGQLKVQSLTVGYPIHFENLFMGGLVIHASLSEINKTLRDVYRLTLMSILLSVLLAYFVLYFQVNKISKPLRELKEAARVIAGGEFQKRLQIHTKDEIEELGNSFNHMAESLEKIEINKRNLIANISHDLRSPMTSIRGFVEGILDGTIPEEKHRHYLEIVLDESKRLIKITNDIMELGNMQQGKLQVECSSFELNESIRRKLVGFEPQITAKGLKVTLVFFDEKVEAYSDQALFERVLQNLIDNAVKFTPQNHEIIIKTEDKGEHIVIDIVNTGVSIDPEELRRIWERFHKGDSSRGKYRYGFGLGLAIVRELVNQLGEKVWVESKQDFVRFTVSVKKP